MNRCRPFPPPAPKLMAPLMVFVFKSCKYPLPVLARSKLALTVVLLRALPPLVVTTTEPPVP